MKQPDRLGDLNPWFVTGLVDGEGCFVIATKGKGKRLQASFSLELREDDEQVVRAVQAYFGVGYLYRRPERRCHNPCWIFGAKATPACKVIVKHFDRYPLQGKKKQGYHIWREFALSSGVSRDYQMRLKHRLNESKKCEAGCEVSLEDHQLVLFSER